jgi:hypothetical protein
MKEINKISAEMILSISLDRPDKIYTGNSEIEIKKIYRALSAKWHPDKHIVDKVDTNAVFIHIKSLYEKAIEKLKDGSLGKGKNIKYTDVLGKSYIYEYITVNDFEMGKYYICDEYIVWEFQKDYQLNARSGIEKLSKLKYINDKMKKEFQKMIPEISLVIDCNNSYVVIMRKNKDLINLKDLLKFYKEIPSNHVAWILSTMYNLICFLHYNKLMQGGLTLENYYVNPKTHEGCLIGGWWFSHNENDKLIILPSIAVDIAPISMLNEKKAKLSLDLEMIKLIGRQLLGDSTGVYLLKNKEIPKRLINWLRDSSVNTALKEYQIWFDDVLKNSFGVRRFIEMKINSNDIYKGE